jgi:RNA polymerase sigma-70 factor (ECF subfamily)
MTSSDPDAGADGALLLSLRRGEPGAARALLERHLEALYEFAHWRLAGDRAATEDLVQDTLVVALEKLERFDGRSSLHAWLVGIARNKLRERRRAERGRRAVPIDELLESADPEIERVLAEVEREPLPDGVLEEEETRELVGAALSSLPPEYRRALVAKYVDELSVAEIARAAGKSEKAVESLLTRARTAFGRVVGLLAKRRGELA